MHIKKHINYCPTGKGIRAAVGYSRRETCYLGYFVGYAGGGVQSDSYFKLGTEFKELSIVCDLQRFSEEEKKLIEKVRDAVLQDCLFNETICFWEIPKEKLDGFEKVEQYGDIHYYFESSAFHPNILYKLSDEWSLLTIYREE
ncbi:MAG: hypothetical protein ACOC44_11130 [Promethearchaeia archaeon]